MFFSYYYGGYFILLASIQKFVIAVGLQDMTVQEESLI